MSKITDLSSNLVPTRLPKKNVVETDKAEEIASKIHAAANQTTDKLLVESTKNIESVPEQPIKETKKNAAKAASTAKSANNRVVRTLLEDPEAVRKTSFDFPVALYRAMKIRLAEEGVSMRDYVMGLIEADLGMLK